MPYLSNVEEVESDDFYEKNKAPEKARSDLGLPKDGFIDWVILGVFFKGLELPGFSTALIDDGPPPQADEQATGYIFGDPEVHNWKNGHPNKNGHAIHHRRAKNVVENRRCLEH